jgi:hypothetical protein
MVLGPARRCPVLPLVVSERSVCAGVQSAPALGTTSRVPAEAFTWLGCPVDFAVPLRRFLAHFYQCVRYGRGENHTPVVGSRNEPLPDMVPQPADAIDIYVDGVAVRESKGVARYDSGPSHQIGAGRKTVIAKEEIGELT